MTAPNDRSAAPRPSRAERRRLLLDHTRRLIAAQGYAATTLEQVAAAAGVRESTLARHFPGKPDLWQGLLDELLGTTSRAWQQETAELADPHARLHAVAERFAASSRVHGLAMRAVARALAEGEDEVRAGLGAFALEWEDFLAGLIASGQQSGFFRRSLDPRVAAWQLIHAALGYALTGPLGIPLHEQDGHVTQAIECAFHSLLKTDV